MKLQLKKHDRICFLGDSITADGKWIAEIFEFFVENYPELEVCMYNCGIGSTRGYDIEFKNRLHREWLNLFPAYSVIMFGANDIGYSTVLEESLAKFRETLNDLIAKAKSVGSTPIICCPTPYDEYNDGPNPVREGVDAKVAEFAKLAEAVAEEQGLIFVDMRTVLMECMEDRPVSIDRVHMDPYGNHLMAQSFLYAIGAIDVIDTDGTFEMSAKNKARYDVEQILRECMFIEKYWHKDMDGVTVEERKKWIENYMTDDKPDWEKKIQVTFNENAEFLDERRGELIKRTLEMYK